MILQDWDELEALRESLREHMAEIKRLNDCLTWEQHRAEHVGTHGLGCAMWGPKHYECLLRAHESLQKRTSQESRQVEPVVEFRGRRNTPEKTSECWGILLCDFMHDPPKGTKLYTAPPKREPLTDEAINALELPPSGTATIRDMVKLIEKAHGIGGEE